MVEAMTTTAERAVSQTKEQIILEAKRIEESLLHSSKGHFVAASGWKNFHLWIGVPMVIMSSIAGAAALARFDTTNLIAGLLAITVAALSGVMTFLNPNERVSAHQAAGNAFDALLNKTRIFRVIDCWNTESDEILTERIKDLSTQKSRLNETSPQIPRWAYVLAKRGIEQGEATFRVDVETHAAP